MFPKQATYICTCIYNTTINAYMPIMYFRAQYIGIMVRLGQFLVVDNRAPLDAENKRGGNWQRLLMHLD